MAPPPLTGKSLILHPRILPNGAGADTIGAVIDAGPSWCSGSRGELHTAGGSTEETLDVPEVLVALGVGLETQPGRIDVHVPERGPREEGVVVVLLGHLVFQQTVHEDHIASGYLGSTSHRLRQEAPIVTDRLQPQSPDVQACVARAAVVVRVDERLLPLPEAVESCPQDVEQPRRGHNGSVRTEGEDRVALDPLDLERGRDAPDDRLQQIRDDGGAVLELGRGDQGREARDVGQHQEALLRVHLDLPSGRGVCRQESPRSRAAALVFETPRRPGVINLARAEVLRVSSLTGWPDATARPRAMPRQTVARALAPLPRMDEERGPRGICRRLGSTRPTRYPEYAQGVPRGVPSVTRWRPRRAPSNF